MDTSYLDKYYRSTATDEPTTGTVSMTLERKSGMFVVSGRGRPMRFSQRDAAYREVRRRNPRARIPELERW